MTAEKLLELLDDAGLNTRQYSGRGMSGKHCPAFKVESDTEILTAGFDISQALREQNAGAPSVHEYEATEDVQTLLSTATTDSMGKGIIVYFPRYTFKNTP
jgi:hypothetical protein